MKNAFVSLLVLAGSMSLVSASPTAISDPVDTRYVCEQSSDCVVKDRGNCCGFWPVCARPEAEFKKNEECPNKNGAVCGWPAISSCACQEGLCVAKRSGTSVPVQV